MASMTASSSSPNKDRDDGGGACWHPDGDHCPGWQRGAQQVGMPVHSLDDGGRNTTRTAGSPWACRPDSSRFSSVTGGMEKTV